MTNRWRYRISGILGVVIFTVCAVLIANHPGVQSVVQLLPLLSRLPADSAGGSELLFEISTAAIVISIVSLPLYKPRPRRVLDTIALTQHRTVQAMIALAAIGYFDYTYRLPRLTVILVTPILLVVLPAWFLLIRRQPSGDGTRALIIGDDPEGMQDILEVTDLSIIGYVSPPTPGLRPKVIAGQALTDGGTDRELRSLACLGGLSRLDEVLVEYDIDTAVLAFSHPDRAEFFGSLEACYEHGVQAKVHRDHADSVLTNELREGPVVDVDLEPWDWQDYIFKRLFDVIFAVSALVALTPVAFAIGLAIKLEDGGSIFYSQKRTTILGDTFRVYKFRSMVENAEEITGAKISEEDVGDVDPRVTSVGRVIRRTHLDEIPQLWSILVGQMSVVGPRPERPELDLDIETSVGQWRSRWFVKPGLTGLAQIHDATGHEPAEKLRYDVEYIRNQSLRYDLKILLRQVGSVLVDLQLVLRN